jgi:hypothetical protein
LLHRLIKSNKKKTVSSLLTYLDMVIPLVAASVTLAAALAPYVMVKFFGVIFPDRLAGVLWHIVAGGRMHVSGPSPCPGQSGIGQGVHRIRNDF